MRENAVCVLAAAGASAAMAWMGLYGFGWNDYEVEAKPSFDALTHGHVLEFLRLAPAYGGSLVERAPFALLPGLWGGGQLAVYRMVALPGLLAAAALGVWLCARMRTAGRPVPWRAIVLGICVANPLTLRALELGHPEELVGACLCVAAVLLAARGHSIWAGVLLGLAIANKEWALIAVGPVLLALPARSVRPNEYPNDLFWPRVRARVRGGREQIACLASTGAMTAVVLAPLVLVSSGGFVSGTTAAASPGASVIFKPWQIWWFFGHYSERALGPSGVHQAGYRIGPVWTGTVSHPLIVVVGLGLAGALWLQRRYRAGGGTVSEREALLLLALVLLLRCILDTWDESYYLLPFVLALLAWEVYDHARPPVLALASTVLAWLSFQSLTGHVSPDAQTMFFLAWTLPLGTWMALRLYGSPFAARGRRSARIGASQETTVSSLGSPVSTS